MMADHRCLVCGQRLPAAELQCHHVVKRRIRATRHDPLNGAAVCIPCHREAEKPWQAHKITDTLGPARLAYLERVGAMLYPDIRRLYALTDYQWRQREKVGLKSSIAYLSTPEPERAGMKVPGRLREDVLF